MLATRLLEAVQEKDKSRSFRLDKVVDLRPIDWVSGKRMPLEPGAGNVCMRCGKEHAICYHVEETTPGNRKEWVVGSGCGPKILSGWTPEKNELARAKKKSTVQSRLDMWEDALRGVELYVKHDLANAVVPEVTWEPGRYENTRGLWMPSIKGATVGVSGQWVKNKGSFAVDFGRPYTLEILQNLYRRALVKEHFKRVVKNNQIHPEELTNAAIEMYREKVGFLQLWNSKNRDYPWVKLRQQLAKMR